jgi:hypothetical protein
MAPSITDWISASANGVMALAAIVAIKVWYDALTGVEIQVTSGEIFSGPPEAFGKEPGADSEGAMVTITNRRDQPVIFSMASIRRGRGPGFIFQPHFLHGKLPRKIESGDSFSFIYPWYMIAAAVNEETGGVDNAEPQRYWFHRLKSKRTGSSRRVNPSSPRSMAATCLSRGKLHQSAPSSSRAKISPSGVTAS